MVEEDIPTLIWLWRRAIRGLCSFSFLGAIPKNFTLGLYIDFRISAASIESCSNSPSYLSRFSCSLGHKSEVGHSSPYNGPKSINILLSVARMHGPGYLSGQNVSCRWTCVISIFRAASEGCLQKARPRAIERIIISFQCAIALFLETAKYNVCE